MPKLVGEDAPPFMRKFRPEDDVLCEERED